MSEQAYFPKPGQQIRIALHWSDIENKYIFLEMVQQGIIVTPPSENKEAAPNTGKIYFFPWAAIDYFTWINEVREDD